MQSKNLQEIVDKLAHIPLAYQPGKGWTYSLSMDIEGYIVEKLCGKTLPVLQSNQQDAVCPIHTTKKVEWLGKRNSRKISMDQQRYGNRRSLAGKSEPLSPYLWRKTVRIFAEPAFLRALH